jgi:hypothetical protein
VYEIEKLQPDQLEITLYETGLDDSEKINLQMNELYIPKLHFENDKNSHFSFQIDPQTFELR